MSKRTLKRIAILVAPIIWRRIRGGRSRHHWRGHRHHSWHRRPHHCGHARRRVWL